MLVTNKTLRQQLAQKGLARAQQFDWEKTADAFYGILQRIIRV